MVAVVHKTCLNDLFMSQTNSQVQLTDEVYSALRKMVYWRVYFTCILKHHVKINVFFAQFQGLRKSTLAHLGFCQRMSLMWSCKHTRGFSTGSWRTSEVTNVLRICCKHRFYVLINLNHIHKSGFLVCFVNESVHKPDWMIYSWIRLIWLKFNSQSSEAYSQAVWTFL